MKNVDKYAVRIYNMNCGNKYALRIKGGSL